MRIKLIKTMFFIVVTSALLTVSALAANTGGATVTASALNLRAQAGTSSEIKTVAPRGAAVIVREKTGEDWCRVYYKGYEGYMSCEYLSFANELAGQFGEGTVKGSSVRMRSGPDYGAATMNYYNTGTVMKVTGVSGPWYKVSYNGLEGYVHSDYMTLPGEPSGNGGSNAGGGTSSGGTSAAQTMGQTIVNTAMKYQGVPYVWAGTSPGGFDCSGFVYYVYKECGYSVNRTAASLYQNGTYVEKSDLHPGDVLCFTTSSGYGIGHCGIYIGDGQFVHASSGTGYVTTTSLSTNYYTVHYYGARRIV